MELIREHWSREDGEQFIKYLEGLSKKDKIEWTAKIYNTRCKVLAIDIPTLKDIAKKLAKGNFSEFIDLKLYEYVENFFINGYLILKIDDLNARDKFLKEHLKRCDNWAVIDTLKPADIKKKDEWWWKFGVEARKGVDTFTRRFGITLLFSFVNDEKYSDKIVSIIKSFEKEKEFYVNMAIAWLLAEMMIKHREKALDIFQNNNLPAFTINKAISKCRDSYRISKEDKEFLLKFKK